jgi:hypothetical protein
LTPSSKIKNSISLNNSGVDIKSLERSASQYYSKSFLMGCLSKSNAEHGMQNDVL